MRQKLSGAFTVLEMLVVIAIIAILIAMLYPAVSGMQERGKITQDMNNLRQLGVATQMYLNDNDGAFFLPSGGATTWMGALHPKYLASWKIFQSPFDKRSPTESDTAAPISYGFNARAHGTGASDPLLSDRITNPSMLVLFAPAQNSGTTSTFTGTASSSVTVDKDGGSQGTASGGTHLRRQRIDACLADLHVENMSWATYKSDQASTSDPHAPQRWDPLAP